MFLANLSMTLGIYAAYNKHKVNRSWSTLYAVEPTSDKTLTTDQIWWQYHSSAMCLGNHIINPFILCCCHACNFQLFAVSFSINLS